jgi:hypothetical protein
VRDDLRGIAGISCRRTEGTTEAPGFSPAPAKPPMLEIALKRLSGEVRASWTSHNETFRR